eukprot:CAMPEP_0119102522 /NCGR_PEP_ID=MMETSP1180-20130426/1244_1 /TAXON_ID=3052 ORGANISM="Chlamydomonas cf sp, Strain CCMP681" /NCGR_SAMPLE_ID=MMETSP1180 /ASSEMBLY_ACC=CAM_ASM_000741 /LENGTH=40 /DNA_ID= /DNA_START= /DNA_END= /DNA_ORIENTATION=
MKRGMRSPFLICMGSPFQSSITSTSDSCAAGVDEGGCAAR